jgi:glycerol-3-phosphate dehydrogenase
VTSLQGAGEPVEHIRVPERGDRLMREPGRVAAEAHDLAIVGGGIYGACLALEAARRGLRPVLVERDDFGSQTSWNTGRIVHGGIRYLQRLDLRHARTVMLERRWFFRHFPDLVRPQSFVMPLYGRGLKRRPVFAAGLALERWLSFDRNDEVDAHCHLPPGRSLGRDECLARFPFLQRDGLEGAGLWYDGLLASPQRAIIEILRWAVRLGAVTLNYVEATKLLQAGGQAAGIQVRDLLTGEELELRAGAVVNCAGPWASELARRFGGAGAPLPPSFRMLKALIDRPPLSDLALAIEPPIAGAHTLFFYGCAGKLIVGSHHANWAGNVERPPSGDDLVEPLLDQLNAAVPALALRREEVLRTFTGLVSAQAPEVPQLPAYEVIHAHGQSGGPRGLVSVAGTKFSTARQVAERTLRILARDQGRPLARASEVGRLTSSSRIDLHDPRALDTTPPAELRSALRAVVAEEGVVHLDDLLLRRTDWLCDPRREAAVRKTVLPLVADIVRP